MGFFDSINDTAELGKNTFAIIGKNKEILKPTLAQIKIGLFLYLAFIGLILLIFTGVPAIQGTALIMAVLIFILAVPLFPFIKMYYRAAQVWMVYHAFAGNNISYSEGLKRAGENKGDIITLTILDMVLNWIASRLKQGTGRGGIVFAIVNIVLWLLGKVIEEAWDLASHFLLPASIIQEKTVAQTLPELKEIKNNITGALAGILGIDFAGDLVRGYITGLLVVFVIMGAVIGFYFNNWILFWILLIVAIGVNLVAKIFVDMVKTIYFTLFYMSVVMPLKIKEEYRSEVTHYLLHQPVSSDSKKPVEIREQKIAKLKPHIEKYHQQGYSDEEIVKFLTQNKWEEDIVRDALRK